MTNIKDESYWINKLKAVPSEKYRGKWNVFGDVDLYDKNLTKLPLQFGVVTGSFNCVDNKLTSLEGSPIEVGVQFNCSHNNLETLEGAPIEVGGDFSCNSNELKSLEGSPIEVDGFFDCSHNNLETLEGLSKYIGEELYFNHNPLEQLNDLLNIEIKGKIQIYNNDFFKALQNTNLDTLEYMLSNHTYWFENKNLEKDFYMNIEQIIIKKRLELVLV